MTEKEILMAEVLNNRVDYIKEPTNQEIDPPTAAIVLSLGALAMKFSRIERVPRFEDGRRESDAEHSFMLSLVASELSHRLYPHSFDHGKVTQYAIVHDLIELKTGDVSTFDLDETALASKEDAEHAALDSLLGELPPFTRTLLRDYERQEDKEARFVRAVDKLLPLVVDIIGQGRRVMEEDHGVFDVVSLRACQDAIHERLQQRFGEFPQVMDDHAHLSDLFLDVFEATGSSHHQ